MPRVKSVGDDLHLTQLPDQRVGALAEMWRERARQGVKGADGASADFEGELRRRSNKTETVQPVAKLPHEELWWKA